MNEYENTRRVSYESGGGQAVFIPVCPICGRYVKSDKKILVNDSTGLKDSPNGTCKKHGRIKMFFEGFF